MAMHERKMAKDPAYLYSSSRKGTHTPTPKSLYQYLAIVIRVFAQQKAPKENVNKAKRPRRSNFAESIEHFRGIVEELDGRVPGVSLIELLWAKFHFDREDEAILSSQFQEAVESLGQFVAGDEKLFKWTGESQWVRVCPQKEDEVGLWNYELVGQLPNDLGFLLYVKSHTCETVLGGGIQCAAVVRDWGRIVKDKGTENATILTCDSYYLDLTGRDILLELEVLYLCALQSCRFNTLYRRANIISHHAGKTALLYSEELHEMFVTHWYPPPLNRKFVLTNALIASPGSTRKAIIPGCDHFSVMFNLCDKYNRRLHDKSWPHRCMTAELQEHNFLFTCLLTNCYNAFLDSKHQTPHDLDYQTFGEELADELFFYACSL
jgi:hypothetical protein